jgi:hypothetical protein
MLSSISLVTFEPDGMELRPDFFGVSLNSGTDSNYVAVATIEELRDDVSFVSSSRACLALISVVFIIDIKYATLLVLGGGLFLFFYSDWP